MTGMKEGTGSDPFAEDVVDEPESDEAAEQEPAEREVVLEESSTSEAGSGTSTRETGRPSKEDIPYIFRRSRVTDERTLHSYYLRDHVDVAEQECRHEVQQQLGEDDEIPKADLREAALLVAYRRPDLIAEELRDWGYDME
jgi:hypothetical protein